jgi:hypothetical protein
MNAEADTLSAVFNAQYHPVLCACGEGPRYTQGEYGESEALQCVNPQCHMPAPAKLMGSVTHHKLVDAWNAHQASFKR